MSARKNLDRQIESFLADGPMELPEPSYAQARERIEHKRQRVALGPWMAPAMSRFAAIGLGVSTVALVLLAGSVLLGSFGPLPGGEPPESIPPSDGAVDVPVGPFAWFVPADPPVPPDDGPRVTVSIPASGWEYVPDAIALVQGGNDRDPPQWTGAWMFIWSTYQGLYVYGDPCHWASTRPSTPATTVDAIAAALAAQPDRGLSEPVDVTVGGYAGQKITLHVPNDTETRGVAFADCYQDTYASFGIEGLPGPVRWQQGPGQIDEIWILDVDGAVVIIDGTYSPATPAELVAEVRAIAESATFE